MNDSTPKDKRKQDLPCGIHEISHILADYTVVTLGGRVYPPGAKCKTRFEIIEEAV